MSQDSLRAIGLLFFPESSEINKDNPDACCCPLHVFSYPGMSWYCPQTALNLPVPLKGHPIVQVINSKGIESAQKLPWQDRSWGVKWICCAIPCSWLQHPWAVGWTPLFEQSSCALMGKPQIQHPFCSLIPSAAPSRASHLDLDQLHLSMSWLFTALSVTQFPLFSPHP